MKKVISVLLILVMVIGLCACDTSPTAGMSIEEIIQLADETAEDNCQNFSVWGSYDEDSGIYFVIMQSNNANCDSQIQFMYSDEAAQLWMGNIRYDKVAALFEGTDIPVYACLFDSNNNLVLSYDGENFIY